MTGVAQVGITGVGIGGLADRNGAGIGHLGHAVAPDAKVVRVVYGVGPDHVIVKNKN